jgi:hypothetical protein
MRIKLDGSLDLDWRSPPPQTSEQIYDQIIADFLHAHPSLTREQAEKQFEGFL